MPVVHQSRTGKTYYLHTGPKRGGGQQYFFSTKAKGELCDHLPEGFEVYETIRGQVFLRRVQPKLIRDEELEGLRRRLEAARAGGRYRIEVRGKTITVHESSSGSSSLDCLRDFGLRLSPFEQERLAEQFATYQAVLRFTLVDAERRTFLPERYCFRGSVDDWICIGEAGSLDKLATRYFKHLGRDSFYELYPYPY